MKKNLNKIGFSLIEMTVVLGLLAGVGLFVSQFLVQGQKGQKKVSANFDFTTKMWEVFNVLQNSSYCNSSNNLVFKERTAAGTLIPAKLSNENTPATNTVNWIGYRVGSGAAAQDIKVLAEGDVIENTLTISEITFERQMTDANPLQVVAASANLPVANQTTHYVNLLIVANPNSGAGFPVTKSFKFNLVTATPTTSPTHEIIGCFGGGGTAAVGIRPSDIFTAKAEYNKSGWQTCTDACNQTFAGSVCLLNFIQDTSFMDSAARGFGNVTVMRDVGPCNRLYANWGSAGICICAKPSS